MPHIAKTQIVVLWEHELRAAAKALEKLNPNNIRKASKQEWLDAIRACYAAIYSPALSGGAPVTVMSAQQVLKTEPEKGK